MIWQVFMYTFEILIHRDYLIEKVQWVLNQCVTIKYGFNVTRFITGSSRD